MPYRYFQNNASGHSASNAYLLALLSYYIYENDVPAPGPNFQARFQATIAALSPPNTFTVKTWITNTEFAIIANRDLVLVVFRGSESMFTDPADWVAPTPGANFPSFLMFAPPNWGASVRVHQGFYTAMNLAYSIIRNEVRPYVQRGAKVFITGHSRGGAIANLCAYALQRDGIHVAGVYTFGAPRVGDVRFHQVYRGIGLWDRTFRWVRNNDPGPKWPDVGLDAPSPFADPGNITHPYYHTGQKNFIASDGRVTMNIANPNAESGLLVSTGDHDMLIYTTLMFLRLSNAERTNNSTPGWLVKGDIPNGLPHLSEMV